MVVTGSTRNRLVSLIAGHVGSNPTLSAKTFQAVPTAVHRHVCRHPTGRVPKSILERCPSWLKERDWKSRVLLTVVPRVRIPLSPPLAPIVPPSVPHAAPHDIARRRTRRHTTERGSKTHHPVWCDSHARIPSPRADPWDGSGRRRGTAIPHRRTVHGNRYMPHVPGRPLLCHEAIFENGRTVDS